MPKEPHAHPFMPNSVPAIKDELLTYLGLDSTEPLFEQIPSDHRIERPLDLPAALTAETQLNRHMRELLARNVSCEAALSFLGGGCWQHYVPAVCDEVVRRSEFLTPVWGTPSSDHGRNQAWFEFTSQLGELLDLDLVALPVYSWGCAAGHAIRMAARLTGRNQVLVPSVLCPERRAVIENYCEPPEMRTRIEIVTVPVDPASGLLDLAQLEDKLSDTVAAVYFENPSYFGQIQHHAAEITAAAKRHGAESIVGVDPISLGVLSPPGQYDADLVVGSLQPLGIHMSCGGGLGGFIASRDEPRYAYEYPTLLVSIAETIKGEHGFGLALMHQCSYGSREEGKDWTGNSVYLWAVASAAYMALMGPQGFQEIGELIIQRTHFAAALLDDIHGVSVMPSSGFFKEFVANFDGTGKRVEDINKALLAHDIFGGLDLSRHFPEGGQSALYCITEIHSEDDIHRLAVALQEVCEA